MGAPQGADGLPLEIGQYRGNFIEGWVERLNYDRTLTPTLLLHLGAGYYYTSFSDHAAFLSFDPGVVRAYWLCTEPPVPLHHGDVELPLRRHANDGNQQSNPEHLPRQQAHL